MIKGKFKCSQDATATLLYLYKQVWDDIRLVMGTWCSEQLPDPDSLPVADYLKTGWRVSLLCSGFTLVIISFSVLLLKDTTAYNMHGEPRSKWVTLKPAWIPNVGFRCHIQLGTFESFVHVENLEWSAWNQPMMYAKDSKDAFSTHQRTQ